MTDDILPPAEGFYLNGCWGQLHGYRAGSGPHLPLVCFHLSPGSARMYREFIAEMGKDRFALAIDTPGYGNSSPPPKPANLGEYATAVGQVIEGLGLEQVDLFGAHTGSRLAVELAHQYPKKIRKLVLFGASVYSAEELTRQKKHYGPAPFDINGEHLVQKWKGWSAWRREGVTDEMVGRYVSDSVRDFERTWWAHRAVFEHDMGERLGALKNEVMVICVDDDIREPTLRARKLIRNGEFVDRPEWGHWFLEVHTKEAADLVRGFLA